MARLKASACSRLDRCEADFRMTSSEPWIRSWIVCEAATGVARSRFRDNRSSWTGWRDFLNTACFRLDPASGRHVVECEVCDAAGNVSPGQAAEPVVLDWMPSLGEHRNLFNGDFGVYFWKPEQLEPEGKPFTAGTIRRFVDLLAESGVDTYVMNPNSKVAWYPSKVWPTVLDGYVRDDPENKTGGGLFGPKLLNPMLDLQEAGVDVGKATRCLKNGGAFGNGGQLISVFEAKYQGKPAVFGVLLEGPEAGAAHDRAVVWVVSRSDCEVIAFAQQKFPGAKPSPSPPFSPAIP